VQLEFFDRIGSKILSFCELNAKAVLLAMQNSLGLVGENAPSDYAMGK
jgi:hypothetical protein